jgi:tetratricopeptide (TPR) repeat protein
MHEALSNWGTALADLARRREGAAGELLFEQAFAKYEAALAIKPDKHEALYNWGNTLADLARRREGAAGELLFEQAFAKYEAALAIKPDMHEALYNWGCLAAVRGRQEETKHWLRRRNAVEPKLTRLEIEKDRDFDRVRIDPWFVELLDELFGGG